MKQLSSPTWELITPDVAREYLTYNTKNYRILDKARVTAYAEDMKSGNWEINGESIIFGEDGSLKDGQHRLEAIIESGKSFPFVVVRNIQDEVSIYDTGGNRTNAQMLKASGYKIDGAIISAVKILVHGRNRRKSSTGEINEYIIKNHETLKEACSISRSTDYCVKSAIGKKASCCLAVYCIMKLNLMEQNTLKEFFRIFNTGVPTTKSSFDSSPALIASRQFLTTLESKCFDSMFDQFNVIVQALNDFDKGNCRERRYLKDNDILANTLLNKVRNMDGIEVKK